MEHYLWRAAEVPLPRSMAEKRYWIASRVSDGARTVVLSGPFVSYDLAMSHLQDLKRSAGIGDEHSLPIPALSEAEARQQAEVYWT